MKRVTTPRCEMGKGETDEGRLMKVVLPSRRCMSSASQLAWTLSRVLAKQMGAKFGSVRDPNWAFPHLALLNPTILTGDAFLVVEADSRART